jgi:hypothetical protein
MFKVSTVSLHALFETPLLDSVIDNTPVAIP